MYYALKYPYQGGSMEMSKNRKKDIYVLKHFDIPLINSNSIKTSCL